MLLGLLISLLMVPANAEAKGKSKKSNSNQTKVTVSYVTKKNKKGKKVKYKVTTTTKYVGKFKLSYYCPCSRCCGRGGGKRTASGTKPTANRTIAADTRVLPMGTQVKIGSTTYTVEDRGGAIKGNRIDVFVNTHSEALKKGIAYKEVYTVKKTYTKTKCATSSIVKMAKQSPLNRIVKSLSQ